MEMGGWIKLHRCMLDNPVVTKDSDHLAVWVWLLLNVTHSGVDVMFKGKRIKLKPGQMTTGRKVIASELQISESKVRRILDCFESEHQIDQQMSNKCRLISILNWDKYQISDQQIDQQVTNNRPTSDQQVTTKQECKNKKNVKNERYYSGYSRDEWESLPLEERINISIGKETK